MSHRFRLQIHNELHGFWDNCPTATRGQGLHVHLGVSAFRGFLRPELDGLLALI